MRIIKRYPNRKLYDIENKTYVTLKFIAAKIREGEEVQVVDHASGEDLTAVTLTQIIFEQEKEQQENNQSGFLPRSLLHGLIQSGGDRFSALQRSLSSSLGFMRQIDEEIHRRIQSLIAQGELNESEGRRILEKLLSPSLFAAGKGETGEITSDELEKILAEREIPSRQDLQRLLAQVDALAAKLDEVSSQRNE